MKYKQNLLTEIDTPFKHIESTVIGAFWILNNHQCPFAKWTMIHAWIVSPKYPYKYDETKRVMLILQSEIWMFMATC